MEGKINNTPVLIIGAGPVGLALALELGLRGIQCLIVEQRDGKVTLPKMNTVNTRTMEFCRRWGVATKIKQAGIGEDYPLDIRFITSMAGYELLRFRYPTYRERGKLDYTPEGNCVCSQLWFDPILLERARSFPNIEVRLRTRLESFSQTEQNVTARVARFGIQSAENHPRIVLDRLRRRRQPGAEKCRASNWTVIRVSIPT